MKKYLCFATVFIFAIALIFYRIYGYPIEWQEYVLEEYTITNPFFTEVTGERGYTDETEVLDVAGHYALCAISSRVTDASKYWMAQATFRNTQKIAILNLQDGSVVWEQPVENQWIVRGKLLNNQMFLYSFFYDEDTTNVICIDFSENVETQRETVLYEEDLMASWIEIIGANPVILETEGNLYFEILKFHEKDICSDICTLENGEAHTLDLNCDRLYCTGTSIYGLSNKENGLCLYRLSNDGVTEKTLKINEQDMERMTDFFVLQDNLYFAKMTDDRIRQLYHYTFGRLQPVKDGRIKHIIGVSEDEIVFQGIDDTLYQMNKRGKIKTCSVTGIPDLNRINREVFPFTAEETIELYHLKSKAEER